MLSIISKNLQNSSQAPNIVLVYGEPGLKKTQSALWLVANHQSDAIYVSAKQSMSTRWLAIPACYIYIVVAVYFQA